MWVEKPEGSRFIDDALRVDKEYDKNISYVEFDCRIEEMFFDRDGALYISLFDDNAKISFSINIPFQKWLKEAIRFGWINSIAEFLTKHINDVEKIKYELNPE